MKRLATCQDKEYISVYESAHFFAQKSVLSVFWVLRSGSKGQTPVFICAIFTLAGSCFSPGILQQKYKVLLNLCALES